MVVPPSIIIHQFSSHGVNKLPFILLKLQTLAFSNIKCVWLFVSKCFLNPKNSILCLILFNFIHYRNWLYRLFFKLWINVRFNLFFYLLFIYFLFVFFDWDFEIQNKNMINFDTKRTKHLFKISFFFIPLGLSIFFKKS